MTPQQYFLEQANFNKWLFYLTPEEAQHILSMLDEFSEIIGKKTSRHSNNLTTEEAKDLAAQEFKHGDFQQLLGYLISGGDILEFQEIEDRAMQIYTDAAYNDAKEVYGKKQAIDFAAWIRTFEALEKKDGFWVCEQQISDEELFEFYLNNRKEWIKQ